MCVTSAAYPRNQVRRRLGAALLAFCRGVGMTGLGHLAGWMVQPLSWIVSWIGSVCTGLTSFLISPYLFLLVTVLSLLTLNNNKRSWSWQLQSMGFTLGANAVVRLVLFVYNWVCGASYNWVVMPVCGAWSSLKVGLS